MHINAVPAATIAQAEKGEIDKLDCHRAGANLECAFDLAGAHHNIVLVRTGSGDWSPDAVK